MQTKNDVIRQLDSQSADVEAYTNGERGGEGYVIGTGDAKLVNRSGFSAANLNKTKWRINNAMENKFTATEWALMEGGHTLPKKESKFNFVCASIKRKFDCKFKE